MKTNIKENYGRKIRGLIELKINHRETQTTKDFTTTAQRPLSFSRSQGGSWEQDIRCVRSVVVVKELNRKEDAKFAE